MKAKIGIAFWLLLLVTQAATAQVQNQAIETPLYKAGSSPVYEDGTHVSFTALSQTRLLEIDKLDGEWDSLSKDDLIKYTIQTYPQKFVDNYMKMAFAKIKKFHHTLPTPAQEQALQKYLQVPPTRQVMYDFMQLLTKEQILTIGY